MTPQDCFQLSLCNTLRALVIHDNPSARKAIADYLRSIGIGCDSAKDSSEGIEMAHATLISKAAYNIILLETMMPGMDGFTLNNAIKSEAIDTDTKLILPTDPSFSEQCEQLCSWGVINAYIYKPIRKRNLLNALRFCIEANGCTDFTTLVTYSKAEDTRRYNAKVLVAEDNIVNQEVARIILESLGCRVDIATNGREAVDAVIHEQYDIVFMDCQMPEMDGYEATFVIRGMDMVSRIPIIALTAHSIIGDREQCLASGMDDYISKPYFPESFRAVLDKWLAPSLRIKVVPECLQEGSRDDTVDKPYTENSALDKGQLDRIFSGNSNLISNVLRLFLSVRKSMDELKVQMDMGNADASARLAHSIKGAGSNIAATELSMLSAQLEEALEKEQWDTARSLYEHLEKSFAEVESAISAYEAG